MVDFLDRYDAAVAEGYAKLRAQVDEVAMVAWLLTDPERRGQLRSEGPPVVTSGTERSFTPSNEVRIWMECEPPLLWCELPPVMDPALNP